MLWGGIQTTDDKGITEGQRRGASGESYVEARLKSFAQVSRPMPLVEYAMDFYCRLLQNGKPSNKIFGVEVKSTGIFKDYYSESIQKDHIRFWLTQPFRARAFVLEVSMLIVCCHVFLYPLKSYKLKENLRNTRGLTNSQSDRFGGHFFP
jgi:hypothetical protein